MDKKKEIILLENSKSDQENTSDKGKGPWGVLQAVLTVQLLGCLWFSYVTGSAMLRIKDEPFQDLLGLFLMALAALALLVFTLVGAFKKAAKARSAALTVQVGTFGVGLGILQGLLGPQWPAVPVLLFALIGLIAAIKVRPMTAVE